MAHQEHEEHHVKFNDNEDHFEKNNCIVIQRITPNKLQVHLGFLKLNHTYDIVIPLEIPGHTPENVNWISSKESGSQQSAYCTFKAYERQGSKGIVNLELSAKKAKLLSDVITLFGSTDPTQKLELALVARVLGKGQGTPMLKDGIRCIAIDADEDSEASDWQGFA